VNTSMYALVKTSLFSTAPQGLRDPVLWRMTARRGFAQCPWA
jgi:hypothetical protein